MKKYIASQIVAILVTLAIYIGSFVFIQNDQIMATSVATCSAIVIAFACALLDMLFLTFELKKLSSITKAFFLAFLVVGIIPTAIIGIINGIAINLKLAIVSTVITGLVFITITILTEKRKLILFSFVIEGGLIYLILSQNLLSFFS